MLTIKQAFLAVMLIAIFAGLAKGHCQYSHDSLVVRELLDQNQLSAMRVEDVSDSTAGRITHLYLAYRQLTTLPLSLVQLDSLEVLRVNHNNLCLYDQTLRDWLNDVQPGWAETQECAGNFKTDSLVVRALLDTNLLHTAAVMDVADTVNGRVSGLFLSYFGLTILPEDIVQLSGLQSIRLSGNRLCDLSDALAQWLSEIEPGWDTLQDCPEDTVPEPEDTVAVIDTVKDFTHDTLIVRKLLDTNGLVDIKVFSVIGPRRDRVDSLDLTNKGITIIPACIGGLDAMHALDLSWNQIDTLPMTLSDCQALTFLSLYQNRFRSLPSPVYSLTQLEKLSAAYNQISHVSDSIRQLVNLELLYLYKNQLAEAPAAIGELPQLNIFRISYNQLTWIPDQWKGLGAMEYLNVQHNHLCGLSGEVGTWVRQNDTLWYMGQECLPTGNEDESEDPVLSMKVSPNPFNATINIMVGIDRRDAMHRVPTSEPTLRIYGIAGQLVVDLSDRIRHSAFNIQHCEWNASDIASGQYVAVLTYGNQILKQKLVLAK
jgi:Leucine-rich repeat (LRR) protein